MKYIIGFLAALAIGSFVLGYYFTAHSPSFYAMGVFAIVLLAFVLYDYNQTKHAIMRNFPIVGRGRYFAEMLRPKLMQYFVESDTNGQPFSREQRSIVYQQAKKENKNVPFGTKHNVYEVGYEWMEHSNYPLHPEHVKGMKVLFGEHSCKQPYHASVINTSAMSFGALSKNAVEAINAGAKIAGFAQNTGEGGISPYHLKHGGDLIWQIGTGYFGCRNFEGKFSRKLFAKNAHLPNVKMIEIKLSQGAKPAHGGILPAPKVTPEIAAIRHLEPYKTVVSPPYHTAFVNDFEMLDFITELRELSGGKPVGIKFCLGNHQEFRSLVAAMKTMKSYPDFITIDGSEGGTGAAPLEFTNNVGTPMKDALVYVHNLLSQHNLRDKIRLIVSGKVITGFDLIRALAIGADTVNVARGFMFSIGCIQALECHNDKCPTGITTHNPKYVRGLVVEDKKQRVANYHQGTIHAAIELAAAAGLATLQDIKATHIKRRVSPTEILSYADIYKTETT